MTMMTPSPCAASNLLVGYVNSLVGVLGVSYAPGQERSFFSTLQDQGLRDNEVEALSRVLSGKSVKLHVYQSALKALTRLQYDCLAENAIRQRCDVARERFESCHDRAMDSLRERGDLDTFVTYAIEIQPVLCQMGYLPGGGCRDVAYEYRSFVEGKSHIDLFGLARAYARASVEFGEARRLLEEVRAK